MIESRIYAVTSPQILYTCPSSLAHRLPSLTVNEVLHGLEPEHRLLDPLEQRPRPADGARHPRLVLRDGRRLLALLEDVVDGVHLLLEGGQNLGEFLHHGGVDGGTGTDVLKVVQHVERAFSRAQTLERLVDEAVGLVFDDFHFPLEASHDVLPLVPVGRVVRVEAHRLDVEHQGVHPHQDGLDPVGIPRDCLKLGTKDVVKLLNGLEKSG